MTDIRITGPFRTCIYTPFAGGADEATVRFMAQLELRSLPDPVRVPEQERLVKALWGVEDGDVDADFAERVLAEAQERTRRWLPPAAGELRICFLEADAEATLPPNSVGALSIAGRDDHEPLNATLDVVQSAQTGMRYLMERYLGSENLALRLEGSYQQCSTPGSPQSLYELSANGIYPTFWPTLHIVGL